MYTNFVPTLVTGRLDVEHLENGTNTDEHRIVGQISPGAYSSSKSKCSIGILHAGNEEPFGPEFLCFRAIRCLVVKHFPRISYDNSSVWDEIVTIHVVLGDSVSNTERKNRMPAGI